MLNKAGRFNGTSPIYGSQNQFLRVGDFPTQYNLPQPLMSATGNVTSAQVEWTTPGIALTFQSSDQTTSCSVTISTVVAGTPTAVVTLPIVNYLTDTVYLNPGNNAGYNFAGTTIEITTTNWAGTGTITISGTSNY